MKILILGAAAGGGFPQWNANNALNKRARAGDPDCPPQTQSSIAVSADGVDWVLFNASPDLRQQFTENPAMHPNGEVLRHTPIKGVVLSNADVDHIAGLLTLRERQAYSLYATSRVLATLGSNSVFNVLNPEFVTRKAVQANTAFEVAGLTITLFPVPGKVALYLEKEGEANFGTVEEDTVGVEISHAGKRVLYVPGCAQITDELKARAQGAALLLFDGTLYFDAEMTSSGESIKTGARMGHISITGDGGSLNAFDDVDIGKRLYIHLNNTNPVLDRGSKERGVVEGAGWGVAHDKMEIDL
ncbi:MAG: pyrroloquinoline quinone biosynthesis protein PqqB [Alphaproteobacteria bacterium]